MHSFCIPPFLEGFGTSAGLIVAIGAQNAFVLRQGILKNHVLVIVLTCALIDALLIGLGIGGFGTVVTSNPILLSIARWGGAAFLLYYGYRSFRAIGKTESLSLDASPTSPSLKETLFTIFAVSFLNPHVYLDTVVLVGSIGAQFPTSTRPFFTLGAISASFIWFFSLGFGARYLAPLFQKPVAWKILDFLIGCIMWAIAATLIFSRQDMACLP